MTDYDLFEQAMSEYEKVNTLDTLGNESQENLKSSLMGWNEVVTQVNSDNIVKIVVNNQELNGFKLLKAGDEVRLGKTHIFDWEKLVLNSDFFEKKEEAVYLSKNK